MCIVYICMLTYHCFVVLMGNLPFEVSLCCFLLQLIIVRLLSAHFLRNVISKNSILIGVGLLLVYISTCQVDTWHADTCLIKKNIDGDWLLIPTLSIYNSNLGLMLDLRNATRPTC